jgi:hypothetical protein
MTRRIAALLAALALVFAVTACGGSDDGDDAASDETTTIERPDVPEESPYTKEELDAIMPTDENVPGDYELEEGTRVSDQVNDEDEDGTNDVLEKACPAMDLLSLGGTTGDNENEVIRSFTAPDGRVIEVAVNPTPQLTVGNASQLVDAINECGRVRQREGGAELIIDFSAELDDSFGDYGLRVNMEAKADGLDALEFQGQFFVVDGVGVSVFASSGTNPDTGRIVLANLDRINSLSQRVVDGVATL